MSGSLKGDYRSWGKAILRDFSRKAATLAKSDAAHNNAFMALPNRVIAITR
ncbi:hypothetical protein ACSYAD_07155 [Acaryochloris marina NIES-2412]|uniref:hypothetical protein n=1 Tax=Acaryochloris marina TaxID=155978 RepID=UPI004057E346